MWLKDVWKGSYLAFWSLFVSLSRQLTATSTQHELQATFNEGAWAGL